MKGKEKKPAQQQRKERELAAAQRKEKPRVEELREEMNFIKKRPKAIEERLERLDGPKGQTS